VSAILFLPAILRVGMETHIGVASNSLLIFFDSQSGVSERRLADCVNLPLHEKKTAFSRPRQLASDQKSPQGSPL